MPYSTSQKLPKRMRMMLSFVDGAYLDPLDHALYGASQLAGAHPSSQSPGDPSLRYESSAL